MLKWLSRLFNHRTSSKIAERKMSIERLIINHQRRLEKLKEYQASPHNSSVAPHLSMEIEDNEIKIQQLQTALENNSTDKEKTEAALVAYQRRLDILRGKEYRNQRDNYGQEIQEIEAKIAQLQAEKEQLNK